MGNILRVCPFGIKQKLRSDIGFTVGIMEMGCITPGLSYVYGTKATRSDTPIGAHSFLHRKAPQTLVKVHTPYEGAQSKTAIRARTPTSSGMNDVVIGSQDQSVAIRTAETVANVLEEMWIGVG